MGFRFPEELPERWVPGSRPIGARHRPLRRSMRLNGHIGKPCPYCGVTMNRDRGWNSPDAPSRDHRIPLARNGPDTRDNIVICCRRCNEEKGCLTPEEFAAVRAGIACRLDHIWNARRSVEMNPQSQQRTVRLFCTGFTRPDCLPCRSIDDVRPATYDSMGEIITAPLCALCRSRLLIGSVKAWEW